MNPYKPALRMIELKKVYLLTFPHVAIVKVSAGWNKVLVVYTERNKKFTEKVIVSKPNCDGLLLLYKCPFL